MTNKDVIKALEQIKTYTAANLLDEIDYVIEVMKKIDEAGIEKPLEADFSKVTK